MTFDRVNSQSLVQFFNQHQKQLHLLIVVLLSIYLLAFAAKVIWRIIPEPDVAATPTKFSASLPPVQAVQSGGDISQLQQLDLFGAAIPPEQQTEAPAVTEAPETNLNLTLTGVVVSSLKDKANAIIENRGTQEVYGLGEKITGTNATLDQVLADRVIIKNGSRHETLMLDGVDYEQANQQHANSQNEKPRRTVPPPRQRIQNTSPSHEVDMPDATASLRQQPQNFTDFIAITPASRDGQLIGYEIRPGKSPELFQSAGLQAGDVVVQINGLDLTDTQQSMEAMNELRQASSIELTLIRDDEYQTIYLDMPEPGDD